MTHAAAVVALLATGCASEPSAESAPVECRVTTTTEQVSVDGRVEMDVLFVIDSSASMALEHEELGDAVARAIGELTWMNHRTWGASLHLGVVTSDLGAGGADSLSTTCGVPRGDDAQLLDTHLGGDATCDAFNARGLSIPFLTFEGRGEEGALESFAEEVRCLVSTGAGGCGFEQPMEAALMALTSNGTGSSNAGFLREHSRLAIVFVTDEDDCSTDDLDLFAPTGDSPEYPTPLSAPQADPNAQCATHRDALLPISRYVDGFRALRPLTGDVTVTVIGGVDPNALDAHTTPRSNGMFSYPVHDFTGLLADATMVETVDTTEETVVPSCSRPDPADPDNGVARTAYPPRRLVTLAQELSDVGSGGFVGSICRARDPDNGDHALELPVLAATIAPGGSCSHCRTFVYGLPRPLPRDADDLVRCDVRELLPVGESCANHPGRTLVDDEGGREICDVTQVPVAEVDRVETFAPEGPGFYYDDFSDVVAVELEPSRRHGLRLTAGAEPISGVTLTIECRYRAPSLSPDVGTPCDADPSVCDADSETIAALSERYGQPVELACDPGRGTCEIACGGDGSCPGERLCESVTVDGVDHPGVCIDLRCDL